MSRFSLFSMEVSVMKNAFALLLTLFIVILFSYLGYQTLATKTLKSHNEVNLYLYEQALHHQKFFKQLLLSMPSFECQTKLTLEEGNFIFNAQIKYDKGVCQSSHATIDTYITTHQEPFRINLHERFIKKL